MEIKFLFAAFSVVGIATVGCAAGSGPRQTLAIGLCEVLFACMLAGVAVEVGSHEAAGIAGGVFMVGVLAIAAVGLHRYLPR